MYQQGDIVLMPFPFSDLSQAKQRPAVILSQNRSNSKDLIAVQVTSPLRLDLFSFPLPNSTVIVPLPAASEVRINKLFTVPASLIVKKISKLNRDSLKQLLSLVQSQFDLE
jgi:mRNA interferase MazF